jgi:nitrogen fixation/metabolism regulation signal transduction histidine kinase
MKSVGTRPKYSVISVRGLLLIYFLLCVLTILFSRNFFYDTLRSGQLPGTLNLIVFFTIPAVLLVLLGFSTVSLFRDIITRRTGSKFKARLLAYFIVIVIFAAAPATIITGVSVNELLRFWNGIKTQSAVAASQSFAVDLYSLHLEKFETLIQKHSLDQSIETSGDQLIPPIISVQDYKLSNDGNWMAISFTGDEKGKLQEPPSTQAGHVTREMPRDWGGLIRYVLYPQKKHLRVISYNIGEDFDRNTAALENERTHFEIIDSLRNNVKPLLIFYYAVFFFPTILMTLIVAMNFVRRVTAPIVELTEATRRVAEGDFSIQILARRGDELGLLIRSFNAMVQDLEKSRAALVKAEKISIWQTMAQQLAHEIKNPLTPIKLSAERLLRRWQNDPENIGEILESSMLAIIQETEGLSILLTEFRTLSKPTEPSSTWTLLPKAVAEIITPYQSAYPGIQFDTSRIGSDVSVMIDKHRLSQVLTNLIINAIDAMDGKGNIEIRTDLVKKREIQYCRLSIKDSGRGITAANSQKIFTPYFTTKESGTGLGLPIVERIINDHGGAIWFNSAEGSGTTFFIDLPIAKEIE